MANRREGYGSSEWLAARREAGSRLAQFRAAAGSPGRPMPLDDFGLRIGKALGATAFDHSQLSKWERGEEDFSATILVAAERAAGLP